MRAGAVHQRRQRRRWCAAACRMTAAVPARTLPPPPWRRASAPTAARRRRCSSPSVSSMQSLALLTTSRGQLVEAQRRAELRQRAGRPVRAGRGRRMRAHAIPRAPLASWRRGSSTCCWSVTWSVIGQAQRRQAWTRSSSIAACRGTAARPRCREIGVPVDCASGSSVQSSGLHDFGQPGAPERDLGGPEILRSDHAAPIALDHVDPLFPPGRDRATANRSSRLRRRDRDRPQRAGLEKRREHRHGRDARHRYARPARSDGFIRALERHDRQLARVDAAQHARA